MNDFHHGLLRDIPPAAETLIDSLQPLKRGEAYYEDPLWVVQELNNTDKHRLLNLTVHGVSSYAVKLTHRGETAEGSFTPNTRFQNGAELGRMPLPRPPLRRPEMRVDGDVTIQVAFDQAGGKSNVPLIPCLTNLADYVERVVKEFMRLPEWGWVVSWGPQLTDPSEKD